MRWIVTNTTQIRAVTYVAGTMVSDEQDDPITELASQGAFLIGEGSEPTIDQFAELARIRRGRGVASRYLDTLMSGAVIQTKGAGGLSTKELWFPPDHNANLGTYRCRSIANTGSHRFTFHIPVELSNLLSLVLLLVPSAGSSGAGKNIDFISGYGGGGEPYNQHSDSDTTSVYDLGPPNVFNEIDITPVFTLLSAGDCGGLLVTQNLVGGSVYYFGIYLRYQ